MAQRPHPKTKQNIAEQAFALPNRPIPVTAQHKSQQVAFNRKKNLQVVNPPMHPVRKVLCCHTLKMFAAPPTTRTVVQWFSVFVPFLRRRLLGSIKSSVSNKKLLVTTSFLLLLVRHLLLEAMHLFLLASSSFMDRSSRVNRVRRPGVSWS